MVRGVLRFSGPWGWRVKPIDTMMEGGVRGRMVDVSFGDPNGEVVVEVPMQRADWDRLKADVERGFAAVHVAQSMPPRGGQG